MAKKSKELLEKRKAAKQKKLLFMLAPVLLILMVLQGPKLLGVVTGGPEEAVAVEAAAEPAAGDAPAGAAPTDPGVAPAPSTAAGADPLAPVAEGALRDSDLPPVVEEGQLVSFGRFTGKDPFRVPDDVRPKKDGGGGGGGTPEPPDGPGGGDDKPADPPPPPGDGDGGDGEEESDAPNSASLDVNGALQTVSVGGAFPTSDPVFRLALVKERRVRVGLVTGEFSNGFSTIELRVGETLTLVSQPDGFRYRIKLVAVGRDESFGN
jgi:hypothetical protein